MCNGGHEVVQRDIHAKDEETGHLPTGANNASSTKKSRLLGPSHPDPTPATPKIAQALSASNELPRVQLVKSDSIGERNRAARFSAVVDVVYYDSKQCHKAETFDAQDSRCEPPCTNDGSRDLESSVCGSSDDGEERASNSAAQLGGRGLFLTQEHAPSGEQAEPRLGALASELDPKADFSHGERAITWIRQQTGQLALTV